MIGVIPYSLLTSALLFSVPTNVVSQDSTVVLREHIGLAYSHDNFFLRLNPHRLESVDVDFDTVVFAKTDSTLTLSGSALRRSGSGDILPRGNLAAKLGQFPPSDGGMLVPFHSQNSWTIELDGRFSIVTKIKPGQFLCFVYVGPRPGEIESILKRNEPSSANATAELDDEDYLSEFAGFCSSAVFDLTPLFQ